MLRSQTRHILGSYGHISWIRLSKASAAAWVLSPCRPFLCAMRSGKIDGETAVFAFFDANNLHVSCERGFQLRPNGGPAFAVPNEQLSV